MMPSRFSLRVYYEDTDAGGVAYHAGYLKFAERARTEWLRGLGYGQRQLAAEQNILFAVRHLAIDYRAAARLDDLLDIETIVTACGGATLTMRQVIRRAGDILAVLDVKLAIITPGGKPVRFPPWLRRAMEDHVAPPENAGKV
jgi:acyl-CoA thioester hydrolase